MVPHKRRLSLGGTDFVECHGRTRRTRGVCNYDVGECYCNSQYYGDACEYVRCPMYMGKECNGEGSCLSDTQANGETADPTQYDTRADAHVATNVGPGGLSRSPEALLGSANWATFANTPTGYLCGSSGPAVPEHSDWDRANCTAGDGSASLSSMATACDSDPTCQAFSIDTGSSNAPCTYAWASTPPKGDNAGSFWQCLKRSDDWKNAFEAWGAANATRTTRVLPASTRSALWSTLTCARPTRGRMSVTRRLGAASVHLVIGGSTARRAAVSPSTFDAFGKRSREDL